MRQLSVIILSLFTLCVSAQNVSTEVTRKNVLLEDFTGIKCGNCPDGHEIVNKIKLSHPDNIFPVAIHAGTYARVTAVDKPNFIIEEGKAINEYYNIESEGYPSGMTNRTDMGSAGLVQSRSLWTMSSRTLTHQDAVVNVWVKSTYNQDTRLISTDVELYYTSDVAPDSSALCVSLLQNRILGPQAGSDLGDEYIHNHVLRAMFTPVWGDTIRTSSRGTLVQKHYEYTLPSVIGNVDTDPQHMDIVAFVIDPQKAVMNVNGCAVECPGMTLPMAANLEAYKILPIRNNAFPYLECYLCNEGTDPITTADFRVTIDDEDPVTCTWRADEGSLASGYQEIQGQQRGYIRVPVEWSASAVTSGCDYKMQLTGINGKAYAGETIKGSFGAMLKVTNDITAVIKTDRYAEDNTFRLIDSNGNEVATYGPYADGVVTTDTVKVHFPENGKYCFEVADSWGNGILYPRGSIKWYDADGNLLASNNDIQNWGYRIFFDFESASGIMNIRRANRNSYVSGCYNLSGQRVGENTRGIIIQNGKKTIK